MMDLYKRVNLLDGTTLEKEIYALERDINSVWTSTVLGKITNWQFDYQWLYSELYVHASQHPPHNAQQYMQVQSILNPLAADLQGWRP